MVNNIAIARLTTIANKGRRAIDFDSFNGEGALEDNGVHYTDVSFPCKAYWKHLTEHITTRYTTTCAK